MTTHLQVDNVTVEISGKVILSSVSLDVRQGEILGLVGPNGSGKSTLLKTIYGHLRQASGSIRLNDMDIASLKPIVLARQIAVASQDTPLDIDLTVEEFVGLGRIPHQKPLASATREDKRIVKEAMTRVGVTHLAERAWTTLSGGERQRSLLARALAQQGKLLILDEPTNHLDIRHQLDILALVKTLGTTTITALHELTLASEYCDRIAVMLEGNIVTVGTPDEVLTRDVVTKVFEVDVNRVSNPQTGHMHLFFSRLSSTKGI